MSDKISIPNSVKFAFGGTSGMVATSITQPLDLVKNRMQMSGQNTKVKLYKNSFDAIRKIIANEGILAIYSGLSAGLLRQATYTTTRLGIYTSMFDRISEKNGGKAPSLAMKGVCGVTAGLCGSFVGTPAEVALIRMTSDGRLPAAERHNYKHVGDALLRIARADGVTGLWRGCLPTMGRAAVVNVAQLVSYSQAKQTLIEMKLLNDGILLHFGASMISGLVTTIASLPVDIVKTRIQNMRIINGVPEYNGAIDAFTRVVKSEGVLSLWKGFTPYYLRIGPHTVITFIVLEQLNVAYFKYRARSNFKKQTLIDIKAKDV